MNNAEKSRLVQIVILVGGLLLIWPLNFVVIRIFHFQYVASILMTAWFIYAIWVMMTSRER